MEETFTLNKFLRVHFYICKDLRGNKIIKIQFLFKHPGKNLSGARHS